LQSDRLLLCGIEAVFVGFQSRHASDSRCTT
jgi:hypothetical protein